MSIKPHVGRYNYSSCNVTDIEYESVYLTYLSIYLHIYISTNLFICISTHFFTYLFDLSNHSSMYRSVIYLSIHLPISLYRLFMYLCTYDLSVYIIL